MEKIYRFLGIAIGCFIGVFVGSSIWKYYDVTAHPEIYAMQSAPWYLSVVINAVFTGIVIIVIMIARWILFRMMKKRENGEENVGK